MVEMFQIDFSDTQSTDDEILIRMSKKDLQLVREKLQKLKALETSGVDNWEGYSYAMEQMEDENEIS